MRQTLTLIGCAVALNTTPLIADVLSDGRMELVAIQQGPAETYCTGLMVGPETILSHVDCLKDPNGVPRQGFSALPGLNGATSRGPANAKPNPREFIVSSVSRKDADIALLQVGRVKGRALPDDVIAINLDAKKGNRGDTLSVFFYTGDLDGSQNHETCTLLAGGPVRGMLDCTLPASAMGAPVTLDDLVVGLVSDPDVNGGSFITYLSEGTLPSIDVGNNDIVEVDVVPFSSVDVLNMCDFDIHHGLFYLDELGSAWKTHAKRIPAMSQAFLPVATVGDAVFSYGRSDDGNMIWGGDDLNVRIKGAELPMVKIMMPDPMGDLTILYTCE